MTGHFFEFQWERLVRSFGDKAMHGELKRLCANEVRDMSEAGFARACDVWIGSRPHHKPPLLSEFREARLAEEKLKHQNEGRKALSWMDHEPRTENLKNILANDFGGASTVREAIKVAIKRNHTDDGKEGA